MNNGLPGPNPTETVTGGKTLELSKYDKIRKPHKVITDDTKIKVTARALSAELCCPICLDLLTCTMTTKECLHRFCQECITTALMRGNKECPTCRKKIVSKRSLRPDPNFDFLISKIWPDRRQYDAELSISMQLFQEQSNVQSLQKSIEEGIKAQAAYRKQRVQGSYDYEKRKRRPPKLAEAGGSGKLKMTKQNSPDEIEESSGMSNNMGVEQVTVSLAPANLDQMEEQSPMGLEMDSADNSGDEEEETSADDTDSDESSSISTDSSISSSSAASSSFSSATNNAQLWENQNQIEQMMDEWRRKGGEDLEVELAPTKFLLRRQSIPIGLKMTRYIRTSSETTISAIAEFLLNSANKLAMAPSLSAPSSSSSILIDPDPPQPFILAIRPKHFFILDRNQKMRKLDPTNTLAFAFLQSIQWDRHLIIYFDLDECPEENIIEGIIGEEMAKTIKKEGEEPIVRQRQQKEMVEVELKNDGGGNNQNKETDQ